MVSFDKATELVRNHFTQDYVTDGFEYNGEYVFRLLSHNYKNMYSQQAVLASVNKTSGEISMFDLNKAFENPELYAKARDNAVKIDEIR